MDADADKKETITTKITIKKKKFHTLIITRAEVYSPVEGAFSSS